MSLVAATATFIRRGTADQFVNLIKPLIRERVEKGQDLTFQAAQLFVPFRTGHLQSTIAKRDVEDDGKKMTGSVEATAEYAGYVEFGTGVRGAGSPGAGPFPYSATWPGQPAKPYMRPALEIVRGGGL